MAATLKDSEERNRRINLVGEYFLKTNKSTREIAEYFSNNENEEIRFKISNKTVFEYIKKYEQIHSKTDEIEEKIYNNSSKSIEDPEVRERVFNCARLAIEGHTMKEIADILETTPKVVERDIFKRLKEICEQDEDLKIYYKVVLNCMKQHQIDTLNENRNLNI